MKYAKIVGWGWLAVALAVTGCNQPSGSQKKNKSEGEHTHGKGPNDGVVFDLGKYHAEFTVDHDKKESTILFVSEDAKDAKAVPVAAKEFTLTTKETKTKKGDVLAPMTIQMLPRDEKEGKAARFVGTDAGLSNVADFEGTVVGVIDELPAKGKFKE